jgi:hypothetical protein
MRIFRSFALVCSIVMLVAGAHAQSHDLFATFNYTHLHTSYVNENDTNGTVVDTSYPVDLNKAGVAVGGDFKIHGTDLHNILSIDVRGTFDPGIYQFVGGLRLSNHRHHSHFYPYVIVGGGFGVDTFNETITTISKAPFLPSTNVTTLPEIDLRGVFAAFGGVDTAMGGRFAWRVEVGGGYTSSSFLSLTSSPGGAFYTVNTGPVLRF